MTTVRRALVLSMAERYVLIALGLLSNILLARLLTPEEIGLYSVSVALIGVAQVLRDFGVGTFLIQVRELTLAHVRTAFGFSLLIGATLFTLIFASADLIGTFYNEARIVTTIQISSLNFLVLPFCTISLSLLRREMAFNRVIAVTLGAAVIGVAVTLTLAYLGHGANAMAIGSVACNVATGVGAWFAREDRHLLLPGLSEWRDVLKFGSRVAFTSVITTISMDINDIAIGKILGFAPVAIISRGQGLMNLFHRDLMGAIRSVAYPAFAKAHRENLDLEPLHLYAVGTVTVFAWPFYAFTALYALELLRLLFGPQWDDAAPLVPWFCLAGAAAATCNLVLPMLTARGRVDLATNADLVIQPLRAVVLVIGVMTFQTLESFAILFSIIFILSAPYIYYVKSKCQPTNRLALIKILIKSLLVTIFSLAAPLLVAHYTNNSSTIQNVIQLSLAGISCGISWIGAIIIFKHPLRDDPFFKQVVGRTKLWQR